MHFYLCDSMEQVQPVSGVQHTHILVQQTSLTLPQLLTHMLHVTGRQVVCNSQVPPDTADVEGAANVDLPCASWPSL